MKKYIAFFLCLISVVAFFLIKSLWFNLKYGNFFNKELNSLAVLLATKDIDKAEKIMKDSKVSLDGLNKKGKSLLYEMGKNNKYEAFKWLLEKGANPNLLFNENCDSVMRLVAEHEDEQYLKIALEFGGNPTLIHSGGYRPLYFSCLKNRLSNIDILVSAGDDGNLADEYNNTTFTCLINSNEFEKVNLLLSKGLNPIGSNERTQQKIVNFIEMIYANLHDRLMPEYLKMVENLRTFGFKIELLNVKEYMKREEDLIKKKKEAGNPTLPIIKKQPQTLEEIIKNYYSWQIITEDVEKQKLQRELKKEIHNSNPLFNLDVIAIAQRKDDIHDVLFKLPDNSFATVRLTWKGEVGKDIRYPYTRLFKDLESLFETMGK